MRQVNYAILGRTRIRIDGRLDDRWGERKLRAMLGALLLQANRAVPIDELAEWIWPDGKIPRHLQATFYTYANRIRNALGQLAEPPELINTGGAYRIVVNRPEIDFFHFRESIERARGAIGQQNPQRASQLILDALEFWVDQPLADLQSERAGNWRLVAEAEHWIPAVDALAQALAAQGRFDDVLRRLADLPIDQQSSQILLKRRLEALWRLHRHKEAISCYLAARRRFLADFDQAEADELRRFYEELTRSGPSGGAGTPATAARPDVEPEAPLQLWHGILDFTGREDLLKRLDSLVTGPGGETVTTGVIVLHGSFGVGKTALAVHWAHRMADRFPDAVLSVELDGYINGPKVEPDMAVELLLTKLGFPVERIPTSSGRAAKLRALLAGRRALVLLDNARNSAHVRPLLDILGSALVLVTSRRTLSGLGRRGAVNICVPPLSPHDCTTWFTRRIHERARTDQDSVDTLTALCGGIPLALRVVAEHIAARPDVPLREFVDELRDVHVLLGLNDDSDDPDGSIRTAVSCSYRELGSDEQRVFRLLGLHPGPDISLAAAAALVGQGEPQSKRNLDALVNANLATQPESRRRYRLHDQLRAYAAERIAEPAHRGERAAAQERMLAFYLHTADGADRMAFPLQPRDELPALPEHVAPLVFADDRAAIDWCIRERATLNGVISFAGEWGLHAYAARLPSAAGEIFKRLGYHDDIVAALTVALRSCQATGDLEGEADTLYNLGVIHLERRDFANAESCLTIAGDRYTTIGSDLGRAGVIHRTGQLYVERGDLQRGIESHVAALELLRDLDEKGPEILVLCRLAEALRRKGDRDAAYSHCSDALWRAERLGSQHSQGMCLGELGAIYFAQGDLCRARGAYVRAMELQERVRDLAALGGTCHALAVIDHRLGALADAERWALRAVEQFDVVHNLEGGAGARATLAAVLNALDRQDAAVRNWRDALAMFADLGAQLPIVAEIQKRLAELEEEA